MKERPILFSAPMVRALLDGSKTQTRRVVSEKHLYHFINGHGDLGICPYGQPGDRLWVRETHSPYLIGCENDIRNYVRVKYKADASIQEIDISRKIYDHLDKKDMRREWVPSIHMFRWASRINLEIITVRVERLQDISEADAQAEGADCLITSDRFTSEQRKLLDIPLMEDSNPYRNGYALLWESINGDGSWEANPWVWVIEFKKVAA
jgi:hypothetical protein